MFSSIAAQLLRSELSRRRGGAASLVVDRKAVWGIFGVCACACAIPTKDSHFPNAQSCVSLVHAGVAKGVQMKEKRGALWFRDVSSPCALRLNWADLLRPWKVLLTCIPNAVGQICWFRKGLSYKRTVGLTCLDFSLFGTMWPVCKTLAIFCNDFHENREVVQLPRSSRFVHPSIRSPASGRTPAQLFAVSNSPAGLKGFQAAPLLKPHEVFDTTHGELQGWACAWFQGLVLGDVWHTGAGILRRGLGALGGPKFSLPHAESMLHALGGSVQWHPYSSVGHRISGPEWRCLYLESDGEIWEAFNYTANTSRRCRKLCKAWVNSTVWLISFTCVVLVSPSTCLENFPRALQTHYCARGVVLT